VSKTAEDSAEACAKFLVQCFEDYLCDQPQVTFAISGGSTPKLLFNQLAKLDVDWGRVHFFWVDERCVPPTDERSNFKLANDHLFAPAHVPEANLHRIHGESEPDAAAQKYVEEIQKFFSLPPGQLPEFDILHRGMGPDAHTASLFPGEPLIRDRTRIAAHVWVEKMHMDRVTLLPGVLLAAKQTILQVTGADKADAVRSVITGPEDLMLFPCQIASRDAKATWFLDESGAANL
jgi:6-phosphogluconolactonase